MEKSLRLRNSVVFGTSNGTLKREDQVFILKYLMQTLNVKSVANYAKEQNISHNGAKLRISARKVDGINVDGKIRLLVP